MLGFRCLGSECEDTCCSSSWEIAISDEDIARLTAGIGEAAAEAMVTRVPNGRGGTVVVLKKLENGTCPKLDAKQLCSLHAQHGESVLPTVCRTYPRVVGRIGDRLELMGRLSCPEVARLALLGDEATIAPAPPELLENVPVGLDVDPAEDAPYLVPFREVRDTMMDLCLTPELSVASRLYVSAYLADQVGAFYRRGIETLDRERLTNALAAVKDPAVQADLHAQRGASSPMEGLALRLAIQLVRSRLGNAPAFNRVARNVATTYAREVGHPEQTDIVKQLGDVGLRDIWRLHQERRAALGPERTERLEQLLARYCRSYWLQEWYLMSPNLMEHVMLLIVRVAMIRFLLVGQPDIRGDADAATLDKAAIDVFYAVSRVLDHNDSIRDVVANMLQTRGMLTVGHAAAMLTL